MKLTTEQIKSIAIGVILIKQGVYNANLTGLYGLFGGLRVIGGHGDGGLAELL